MTAECSSPLESLSIFVNAPSLNMFLLCTNSVLLNKALIVQFGSYCLCAGNKTKGQHGLISKSEDLSEVKKKSNSRGRGLGETDVHND